MKRFYKISAIVALTALIFGAAFSIAGVCIGGTVEAAGSLVEAYGIYGLHFHFPFFWFGSDQEVEVDRGKESMPIEESDTPELETIPEVEKVEKKCV